MEPIIQALTVRMWATPGEFRDELAQEARIKVYVALTNKPDAGGSFLFVTARRAMMDAIRNHLAYRSRVETVSVASLFPAPGCTETYTTDALELEWSWSQLEPPEQETLLTRGMFDTDADCADTLGLNYNTYKTRLFRARAKAIKTMQEAL